MRTALTRTARVALLPTAALALALLVLPSRAALAVHVWLLVMLALVALAGLGALRRAYPPHPALFARSAPARSTPTRFPSLERVEREVTLAATSAYDVHFRLRPTLREVATELLGARRGIALDRAPGRARELLGDETWELVRADRRPPADPRGPGLDRDALERVLSSLESL